VGTKRKRQTVPTSDDEIEILDDEDGQEDFEPTSHFDQSGDGDDDDEIVDDWSHSMRSDFPPPKKQKSGKDGKDTSSLATKAVKENSKEVFLLDD
jgi:hypothetical protein